MGATKLNIRHVRSIATADLEIDAFKLNSDTDCSYITTQPVSQGEIVLLKASFKNPGEAIGGGESTALCRRRVVPFVTRVTHAAAWNGGRETRVAAKIENMTDDDRVFFFKKYVEMSREDMESGQLEIEGKRIQFV